MVNVKLEGLLVRFLPNTKKSMVLLDDHNVIGFVIPKGFEFDGASFIDEDNNVRAAALLHDYFYRSVDVHSYTRRQVDKLFRNAMLEFGVSRMKATTVYVGVRMGGGSTWRGYRENQTV